MLRRIVTLARKGCASIIRVIKFISDVRVIRIVGVDLAAGLLFGDQCTQIGRLPKAIQPFLILCVHTIYIHET